MNNQQNKLQKAFHLVRDSLGQAAERRKHAYDLRTRQCRFTRNMWIWYFTPRRRVQLSHKWQSFYDGPYLVIRAIGEVNVEIQRTSRTKGLIVHIDKLKLCHVEGLVSWLLTDDVKLFNHASDGIHVPRSPLEPIHVSSSAPGPTHANDDNLSITTRSPAAINQIPAHDVTIYASLLNAHVALRPRSSIQKPLRFRCRTPAAPQSVFNSH